MIYHTFLFDFLVFVKYYIIAIKDVDFMEILESSLELSNNYLNLCFKIEYLLFNKKMSIEQIYDYLKKIENVDISIKDVYKLVYTLLSNYKGIIRHDYWDSDPEYEGLDKYYWDSSYQHHYYSFEQKEKKCTTFLLISDTHIGNEQLFNEEILKAVYDFALENGIDRCFHLGDLFEGNQSISSLLNKYLCFDDVSLLDSFEDVFKYQLECFIKKYPHPDEEKMRTYCLLGNHDLILDRFLKSRDWWCASDLKKISIYDNSFSFIPRSSFVSILNNVDIHFNHYLYMSGFFRNLKINSLDDIEKTKLEFGNLLYDFNYDFFISGHLHKGTIYSALNPFSGVSNLYLTVPSTSSVNLNGVVAFIVTLDEDMVAEISTLSCDNNYVVSKKTLFSFEFGKENKRYMKVL